jgi:hypothetical protein
MGVNVLTSTSERRGRNKRLCASRALEENDRRLGRTKFMVPRARRAVASRARLPMIMSPKTTCWRYPSTRQVHASFAASKAHAADYRRCDRRQS